MRFDTPTRDLTFAAELLNGHPDSIALVADGRSFTRGTLRQLVAARRDELQLPVRSVVVLTGPTCLEWVVTYLALLDGGHVPLLAGDHADDFARAWSAAALVTATAHGIAVDRRPSPDTVALHPDLALLLATSGSTGAPKLVRLSHRNLSANARAIAEVLQLGPTDRGITSLPLHYCYGLSVLHAHLVAGSSVVLTGASVVDPCFRQAMARHGVSNIAGVPHTFDLIERVGFDHIRVPSLRLITQAGGRLPARDVTRWLDRTEACGIDFYVMYGQTEATARMAIMAPEVARRHPESIGRAIPGGRFDLRPIDGHVGFDRPADVADGEIGELVYRGPNVMLGYATHLDDLTVGPTVDELRTGDLARFHTGADVFEIVGRRSRFIKPFGVRIDLDAVQAHLTAHAENLRVPMDAELVVGGDDDHGVVIVAPGADADAIATAVGDLSGLPQSRIAVRVDAAIPRTPAGKIDGAALIRLGRAIDGGVVGEAACAEADTVDGDETVRAIYASVLGRAAVRDDDTFVSLGGDSLSYVECSIRIERALGRLPADWHLTPVASLTPSDPRRLARLDTTALLRAIGVCAVVATHMHLWFIPGGAHLLLAVVGYNASRFLMSVADARRRVRSGLRTAARVIAPALVWIVATAILGATYGIGTLLLVNNYVGPRSHGGDHWHFWFIEVFAHLVIATTLILAIPQVRRADLRFPYLVPLAALGILLVFRMEWAQMGDWYNLRYRTHGVAWLFALGWLIHRSSSWQLRLLTSALCVLTVSGFFRYPPREWMIVACLLLLLWHRELPVPRRLVGPVAIIAAASIWIYITHFTIWPPLVDRFDVALAYPLTIAAGVGVWAITRRASSHIRTARRRRGSGVSAPADSEMTDDMSGGGLDLARPNPSRVHDHAV